MKNTVMVPLVFFLNLLIWIPVISFFSVFTTYNGMTVLTSGSPGIFLYEWLYRAAYYLPLCVSLSLTAVFLYVMRHKTIIWLTGVCILAVLVLFVFILLPYTYRFLENETWTFLNNRSNLTQSDTRVFSPGIIHTDNDSSRVVWLSIRDGGTGVGPLVVSKTDTSRLSVYSRAGYRPETGQLVVDGIPVVQRADGIDPLFEPVFTPPGVLAVISERTGFVMNAFVTASRRGYVTLVFFASALFFPLLFSGFSAIPAAGDC